MKKIYIFRHGETDWNKNKEIKYCKDAHNVSLNSLGIQQVKLNLGPRLKNKNIQYIYTSKLKRAIESGKILADFLNIDLEIVDGLEEFSIYDDTVIGLNRAEIKEKIGIENFKLCRDTNKELLDWRPLNCETKREARKRIVETIYKICENNKYSIIAIASHGVIIREFLKNFDFNDFSSIDNCEVIEFDYNDGNIINIKRNKCENSRFKK